MKWPTRLASPLKPSAPAIDPLASVSVPRDAVWEVRRHRAWPIGVPLLNFILMISASQPTPAQVAVDLVHEFFARVWGPDHDLAAIDQLMTHDYRITSGGRLIAGRDAFKGWVRAFQTVLLDARTVSLDAFATAEGDRVVSRWLCTGRNNGIFGLPPDGQPVEFTGIAIWRLIGGRFAECWAERAGLEAYRALAGGTGPTAP